MQLLWITPLRALAKDIGRAMEEVIADLNMQWKVGIRNGDTPISEREKQKRQMPEVLIITPESLHLLLALKNNADIFKSLKGEINVVVADFSIAPKEMSYPMPDGSVYKTTTTMPTAKMVLTASIGDKAAFAKIMEKAVESGIAVKTANGYSAGKILSVASLYLTITDKDFVLASDSATYAAYKAGTGKAVISADVLAKMKGKSTAAFVDLNSILTASIAGVKDESATKILTLVNKTFKNVVVTADNFDGKGVKSEFEINMTDSKQNSLVSVLNLISDVFTATQEIKAKRMAQSEGEYQTLKDLGVVPQK